MSSKTPIKIPPSQLWREFRMRFLPIAVFICGLVAAGQLWKETVVGPTMAGAVEPIQTLVIAPDAGVITNLLVRRYQTVKAGDPVAMVTVTDARAISSQVQDMRSKIAMSQLEMNSIIDRERLAFDYQALSMNTLRFRADLAAVKAELPTLEATLARYEQGLKDKVVAYNDYEFARLTRDSVRARASELEKLVAESETRLKEASHTAGGFTNFTGGTLADTMKQLGADQQLAATNLREPVILRAPIDGTVAMIMRRAGENVLAGETILTINALESDRIVAYIRQGSTITPKKGMAVTVRCRTHAREEALSKIEEVGHFYEAITNQALARPGIVFELGMPFGVSVPPALRAILHPGEIVDLAIQ